MQYQTGGELLQTDKLHQREELTYHSTGDDTRIKMHWHSWGMFSEDDVKLIRAHRAGYAHELTIQLV